MDAFTCMLRRNGQFSSEQEPPQFQELFPMLLPPVLKRGVSVLPLNHIAYTRRQWDTCETHEGNLRWGRQRQGGWDKGDKTATSIRINRRILTISNEMRGSNLLVLCKKWQSLLLASPVCSVICFWRTGRGKLVFSKLNINLWRG